MSTLGIAGAVGSLLLGVSCLIFFYVTVVFRAGESHYVELGSFWFLIGYESSYIVAGASGVFIALGIIIAIEDRKRSNKTGTAFSKFTFD